MVREVPTIARFREEHDNEEATDRWIDEEQVAPVSLATESQLLGKRGLGAGKYITTHSGS